MVRETGPPAVRAVADELHHVVQAMLVGDGFDALLTHLSATHAASAGDTGAAHEPAVGVPFVLRFGANLVLMLRALGQISYTPGQVRALRSWTHLSMLIILCLSHLRLVGHMHKFYVCICQHNKVLD